MHSRHLVLLVTGFLVSWSTATAEGQTRQFTVAVELSGEDVVGTSLAYAVREEVRRSAGYKLGTVEASSFIISLVSVDGASAGDQKGNFSAVAISYLMANYLPYQKGNPQTWYPVFLSSVVMTCGRSRVEHQAKSIVASLDESVQEYFRQAAK